MTEKEISEAIEQKRKYEYEADPDAFWPFSDDFIFMMVMQDVSVCTEFLKMILPEEDFAEIKMRPQDNPLFIDPAVAGEKTEDYLQSVEIQKTMKFQRDRHGVRLDALAKGTKQWSSIEMQTWKEPALGKRTRFYRCNTDLDQLAAGAEYEELKRSYVIFICTYDPFKMDKPVYYFQSWDNKNNLNLGDEAFTIILNTKCSPEKVPEQLKAFYEYMNDPRKCEGSSLVKKIDERVRKYNSQDWRVKRMRFEELRREQYKKGVEDATERLNKLTALLLEEGRTEDLKKSVNDPAFQQQLLEEFGLLDEKK